MSEPLDSAEVETVASPASQKRIYVYRIINENDVDWERHVGSTKSTGRGLLKVGETTKPTARERIYQQLGTAYPGLAGVEILIDEPAQRADGTWFGDRDVHAVLKAQGIKAIRGPKKDSEKFEATLDEVKAAIVAVRNGTTFESSRTLDFPMRPEQEDAVALTAGYFAAHADDKHTPKFLWNAKMRFGKTFTAYQVAREMGWKRVLVLTYKPAVQTAWKDDLLSHVDFEGWQFVDRDTPVAQATALANDEQTPLVWFASFQDLGGKDAEGAIKERNETIHLTDWDCIVLDEYHFGAWREGARELYDPADKGLAEVEEPDDWVTAEDDLGLDTKHVLYLSGTPFRAITGGEFTEDQIFNWTYVDEQREKAKWEGDSNPYIDLPQMRMYAYEMGASAAHWAEDGEFNGFSLSEYFRARRADPESKSRRVETGTYVFDDPTRVSEFLEMLRGKLTDQMKSQVLGGSGKKAPFPYESPDFTDAIKHSVWYMADVAACFAMRDLLQSHPYFKGFEIVVAAGSGAGMGAAAKPPVEQAIDRASKQHKSGSITLSCGKLMTGVTIREWGAILMLRSLKSPESYFQAAFRVQSPWSYREPDGSVVVLKDPVLVFEFDPNRALGLVAEYGLKLGTTGDTTPQQAIGELINYLPIFQFSGGAMLQLDAADVLNIATTGVGASALARRWNDPLLVEVNEHTLSALLDQPDLLEALEQIEDFRNLANMAEQVVTSTKKLKKAERDKGKKNLDDDEKKEKKESNSVKKQIREKLQKFLAKIPVFMYVTDFREEALKDIIESLDSDLFTRVTGLTVEDFRLLNKIGVFNASQMDAAIWQFRSFENASLHYADVDGVGDLHGKVGLWDTTVDADEMLEAEQAVG
ncbi:GIY-YIG nuclease family protein [Nocardioides sp. LS1]|uniref:GIY-YIG nuclease family protein n=1 Tax=Nocardioides sp. LS1 TaxID=1027620 RepID=UPI000F617BDC|nr:GIY-YIG nuclease family protein [Nocardioides sp. LS1]GCD88773.1 type III restriction endonuclease [Nocardioides sp. LS1]